MSTYKAHIFKQRNVGEREEVGLKLFMPDGTPIDLSEGGGGGGLRKVEATLGQAEILTLGGTSPYTPYMLISPTEPDLNYETASSFPVIVSAFFSVKIGSAAYENLNLSEPNYLFLVYGSDWSTDAAVVGKVEVNPGNQAVTTTAVDMLGILTNTNQEWFGQFHTRISPMNSVFKDNGLYLAMDGPNEPLAGGNPTDQLKVTIWYEICEMV